MSSPTGTSQEIENTQNDIQSPSAVRPHRTPLPAGQIACLLLLRFCESASIFVVLPFLQELITSVIGGSKKVGYYAGLLNSVGQVVSLITVMYWSRLSDIIGRKPILLLGTAALAVSMISFGLSKTFLGLVISSCIFMALNSNAGVIKSIVGEITDSTNRADTFALFHAPWALGSSIGSLLGGWLARPHEHFPSVFPSQFWEAHPYFLPCATVAVMSALGFFVALGFLNETVPGCYFSQRPPKKNECEPDLEPLLPSPHQETPKIIVEDPVPLRDLLNQQVLIPVFNYVSIAFLHTSSNAIQPLFLAMPISLGGLEFNSRQIGTVISTYGAASAIVQTFFLGMLVRKFGVKKVFLTSMVMFLPMFGLPPVMNVVARNGGGNRVIWLILVCQQSFSVVTELGYGCIYVYITSAAPNKRSLGATNGLSQTLVAVVRIVAPVFSSGLLSFSIERHLFGGYAAHLALCVMTIGCLYLASRLPMG